jgi:hypothetical protein
MNGRELLAGTRELWTRPTHLDDVTFDAIAARIELALREAEAKGLDQAIAWHEQQRQEFQQKLSQMRKQNTGPEGAQGYIGAQSWANAHEYSAEHLRALRRAGIQKPIQSWNPRMKSYE